MAANGTLAQKMAQLRQRKMGDHLNVFAISYW
jgi:hypothetical protein